MQVSTLVRKVGLDSSYGISCVDGGFDRCAGNVRWTDWTPLNAMAADENVSLETNCDLCVDERIDSNRSLLDIWSNQ